MAAYLKNKYDLPSVFLCMREEEEVLNEVEKSASWPLPRAVDWPLQDVMALISGAKIFLGNDSGPAHVAAAARIPVALVEFDNLEAVASY